MLSASTSQRNPLRSLAQAYIGLVILIAGIFYVGGNGAYSSSLEAAALRLALEENTCNQLNLSDLDEKALKEFYSARDYGYLWIEDLAKTTNAGILIAELQRSKAHALKPSFYEYDLINILRTRQTRESRVCFDILLSKAFVMYANDIANGYIRSDRYPEHTTVEPLRFLPNDVLDNAKDASKLQVLLKSLLTTDSRYVRLISKLTEFLRVEDVDAWPEVRNLGSSDNPSIDPEIVRQLLLFTGDLSVQELPKATRGSTEYKRAIARFQARHGLTVTQEIDLATFQEMSMPLSERIELILINLERRRWQNHDLGQEHVYVNAADKSIRFVRNGKKEGGARLSSVEELADLPTFTGEVIEVGLTAEDQFFVTIQQDITGNKISLDVEGPADRMLAYLLGQEKAGEIELEKEVSIELDQSINAFVTYLTVWANKDGTINFRPDIFKRDREIKKLLGVNSTTNASQ